MLTGLLALTLVLAAAAEPEGSWVFYGGVVSTIGVVAVALITTLGATRGKRDPAAPEVPAPRPLAVPQDGEPDVVLERPDPTGAATEVYVALALQIADLREAVNAGLRRVDTLEDDGDAWRDWHAEDHAMHLAQGWPVVELPERLRRKLQR